MKNHFRKIFLGFSISALLLLTGLGCQGLSKSEQQAILPVSLEYWTVFDDVDQIQKQIENFRVARPYLTVNVRQFREEELYPRLVEALAEDRGPDIISVRNRSLGQFQSKLQPMPQSVPDATVIIETHTIGKPTTIVNLGQKMLPTTAQIDKEFVQTVKKDAIRGGNIYGLPLSLDTMAVFYNKDLLDRSGVAEPPKTWAEFQAAAKKITKYEKASGKITQSGAALGSGNNVPGNDDLLYILFSQSKVGFVDRAGQAVFNLGSNREGGPAMQVVDFYTDFANPNRDTYSWNASQPPALDAFVNGSLAFFFGYSYHLPIIKARAPQLNFAIIPLFQLNPDQPVNAANYWLQSVAAKSKHPNEAWNLIDYLARSAAAKEYVTATGRPAALRANVAEQAQNLDLAPFANQALIAGNWYSGKDYAAAARALSDLTIDWIKEPPNPDRLLQWKQEVLNRSAARINQTL